MSAVVVEELSHEDGHRPRVVIFREERVLFLKLVKVSKPWGI